MKTEDETRTNDTTLSPLSCRSLPQLGPQLGGGGERLVDGWVGTQQLLISKSRFVFVVFFVQVSELHQWPRLRLRLLDAPDTGRDTHPHNIANTPPRMSTGAFICAFLRALLRALLLDTPDESREDALHDDI